MGNPYIRAWRLRAANQRRVEGTAVGGVVGPLVATALLVPLFQPVFLGFLAQPPERWVEGTGAVLLRMLLLVAGWMALEAHQVVLRTGDRRILGLLPVDPGAVVQYELLRLLVRRAWLVPAVAALLSPIALAGAPRLWLAACTVVLEAWLLGAVAAAGTALLAIDAAEDPRWAPLLDAVRGSGPRQQAALIWAPGVVLAGVGGLLPQSAQGAILAAHHDYGGIPWVVAPWVVCAGISAAIPRLAARAWFRGSALIAEIDARYAVIGEKADSAGVYLDWAVRWLPPDLARWALLDLRHGWRARRSWITGAWIVGVGALFAGWTTAPDALVRAVAVGGAGAWLCGAVSPQLDGDEPAFTRVWLPDGGARRLLARGLVVVAWLQPCAGLAAFGLLIRHGVAVVPGLALVEAAVVGAAVLGVVCRRLRWGVGGYAPVAAVAAGLGAAGGWLLGGVQ